MNVFFLLGAKLGSVIVSFGYINIPYARHKSSFFPLDKKEMIC